MAYLYPQFPKINFLFLAVTDVIDTTSVPMDLEPESMGHHSNPTVITSNSSTARIPPIPSAAASHVDIENELREYLEGGSGSLAPVVDDNCPIEQMLLD